MEANRHADVKTILASSQETKAPRSTQTLSSSDVKVNATDPEDKIHLRLAQNEAADCFMHTITSQAESSGLFKPIPIRNYKEVYAMEGSISLQFTFEKAQLQNLSKGCETLNDPHFSEYCCSVQVRVPTGLYVALAIRVHNGSKIRVYDSVYSRDINDDYCMTAANMEYARVYVATSNVVNILQSMQPYLHGKVNRFYLRFQALRTPDFQVIPTAVNKGIVRTALHQDFSRLLNLVRNPWIHIAVPSGHIIMVSCFTFSTVLIRLLLYAGDRGNETLAEIDFKILGAPCTNIYNTSLLRMKVEYFYSLVQTGFQLQFSYHNESALPTRLANNSWDCSVPYTSDFIHHLSCNKEEECHNAADEVNCSYTSDRCGPGYLTMGGACFFYLRRPRSKMTWNEAYEMCSVRGGRMAVLNTPEKWDDAIRLMPNSRNYVRPILVFIGITNTPSVLPMCDGKKGHMCVKIGPEHKAPADVLCEKTLPPESATKAILINGTDRWPHDAAYVECPSGHFTHQFLACDAKSSCWLREDSLQCDSSQTPLPPSFTCSDQTNRVPYTLVCDYRVDCVDGSDEDFCGVERCRSGHFSCDNGECILSTKVCDGWGNCQNDEDEERCGTVLDVQTPLPPPVIYSLDDSGELVGQLLTPALSAEQELCPHTHFQCPDTEYCLPIILRCNGAYDCPGREDEADCETCPGFYRCRASKVCLQYRELCDGHAHCPQHDDELMCNMTCPVSCVCRGLAFFCKHSFITSAYPLLRFLNTTGSAVTPAHLTVNKLLIHLILANCGLTSLDELFLPNLLILNVQDNQLKSLSSLHLDGMPKLRDLSVAGSPLVLVFESAKGHRAFPQVVKLDLSRVVLHDLNVTALSAFPRLRLVNLSHSGVQRVQGEGFRSVERVRVIDLRGCPMILFPRGLFQGLSDLQAVHAQSFKVCCPKVLPKDFNIRNCFAPYDEISSCDDLLRGNGYGISVFVFSLFSLVGNAISFIFRSFVSKKETKLGYGNFVTHLSASDFCMGIYLAIIGAANQVYRGTYLWNDESWRHSVACKLAGFLSLLSSETSVLIMCLITLDRFLVLRFPFSRLHFSPVSAHVASVIVWIWGIFLASVPLLPLTSHWEFYSQTGICIPLPITRTDFAGQNYSFSILIVFNFVVFVVISLGQLVIYWSICTNSMSLSNTTKKTKDLSIARRLITVAMTDFMCWFPIGVLGLLASNDVPVPGEVNVAVAIFVLPLNAAVNPVLYTFNVIMERRSRAREEKLRAMILAQHKAKN